MDEDPVDVGYSLATTRAALEHRAVVLADDREGFLSGLHALANGRAVPGVIRGRASGGERRVVFVFPGQGAQWAGMGAELLDSSPVFAERMRECAEALEPYVDWRLTGVVRGEGPSLDRVDVVQPVTFAVMVSLAALWRAHGVEPFAVLGHSQGEIAAACVAGALSLADAAKVVALRSRAIAGELSGHGGMASVSLPSEQTEHLLPRWGDRLGVAVINGPSSTVVSGDPGALEELLAHCAAEGIRARRIPVDYASHSDQVEAIRDRLVDVLSGISPRSAGIGFYSTVEGELIDTGELDGKYWYRNLRQTVHFERSVLAAIEQGCDTFIEVSPHPVLTPGIAETADDVAVVTTLRRDDGGWARFLTSLAEAQVRGVQVDWSAAFADARRVDLPTYAFQRQRYWLEESPWIPGRGDDWRYRVVWRSKGDPPETPELLGNWLVVRGPGPLALGAADEWAGALAERGARVVTVEAVTVEGIARVLAEEPSIEGIVSLLGFDERPHPDHPVVPVGLAGTLALVQALAELGVEVPLWLLTRGAVSTGGMDRLDSPVQAQVWGLGRVVALEYPRLWGGLVDLPEQADERALTRLCGVLAGWGDEDQLAVRDAGVFLRRLVRAPEIGTAARRWQPRGTALVTGGTGALGPEIARWLARNGAEHVVLVSRGGSAVDGLEAELTELGARVTMAACDVADSGAVAELLRRLDEPVRTVIHAAALMRLDALAEVTLGEFADTLAAKVAGAVHLNELLDHDALDAFVLFSSIAGVWGSGDHGAYAAANAFLDALAQRLRADGRKVTSVAWGVWDGARFPEGVDAGQLRRQGLPLIDPGRALAALQRVLDHDEAVVSVADVDWERFVPVFTSARPRPLLDEVPEVGRILADAADEPSLAHPGLSLEALLELVRDQAATVLGHATSAAIEDGRAFRELGYDSLTAVELRNRLAAATGLKLPSTLVFDHPTPAEVAGYLRIRLGGDDAGPADSADLDADVKFATDEEMFELIERELGAD